MIDPKAVIAYSEAEKQATLLACAIALTKRSVAKQSQDFAIATLPSEQLRCSLLPRSGTGTLSRKRHASRTLHSQ
ncbi:MAG: hypothetical protein HC903_27605 [Methylacidiphilales bacterium]|nr:hypothetical protein [Candidatus Methylacidiphilales bacterium]NJR19125.1 hypothetical protein [Calothrix sp. CSU_2_0]